MRSYDALSRLKEILPREHGAWGILLIPYFISVGIAGIFDFKVVIFLLSILLIHISRHPLSLFLKSFFVKQNSIMPQNSSIIIGVIVFSIAFLIAIFLIYYYQLYLLVPIGIFAIIFFILQFIMSIKKVDRTILGELFSIIGLTITAPTGYYIAKGLIDRTAFAIWVINIIYFAGGVFYVKMQLKAMTMRNSFKSIWEQIILGKWCIFYLLIAITSIIGMYLKDFFSIYTPISFLPIAIYFIGGIIRLNRKIKIKQLGYTLLGHSIVFAILLIISFKIN